MLAQSGMQVALHACRSERFRQLWMLEQGIRTIGLSKTVLILADKSSGQGAVLAQGLRAALEGSAKPPRDPTRIRPGAARGRSSRPMR